MLDLRRSFDAVLLASALINTPDLTLRKAMLNTARRHTTPGGSVLIQRHPPGWFDTLVPSTAERDGIRYTVGTVHREGPLLTTTVEYHASDRRWTHTFTTYRLTDDELTTALHDAGFGGIRWLTEDHSWVAATVSGAPSGSRRRGGWSRR
jgi:hypothetical protein